MKTVLLLLFCAVLNLSYAQTTEPDWLQKADRFYNSKNYTDALPAYREAYKLNKNNETTIYRILFSQNELKQYDDAVNFLASLPITTIVNNEDIAEEFRYSAQHSSLYDKSLKLLKDASVQKPYEYKYLSAIANTHSYARHYADAASMFALLDDKTEPGKLDYENWCYALNELKRSEEAASLGKKAIGKYKDYAPVYSETGYAYKELKKYNDAKYYFDKALRLDSTRASTWRYLGEVCKELGNDNNIEQAINCFNKVINMNEATATTYYNLGWCYNDTEDFDFAENYLRKSIDMDSTASNSYLELGYAQYKQKKYADAIINFKKTAELNSQSELAHYYAGLTYYMQKDQYNLRREYEQLKSMNSTEADKLEKYLK
jgi:tetratricopeptide (TPR) repeat protein